MGCHCVAESGASVSCFIRCPSECYSLLDASAVPPKEEGCVPVLFGCLSQDRDGWCGQGTVDGQSQMNNDRTMTWKSSRHGGMGNISMLCLLGGTGMGNVLWQGLALPTHY